jgi:hypothetical protein
MRRTLDVLLSHDVRHGLLAARYHLHRLRCALMDDPAMADILRDLEKALRDLDRAYTQGLRRVFEP